MIKFDDTARYWHRLWSVRFAILSALVAMAGELLPIWKPMLGAVPYATLSTVFAVAAAVSRVVHQGAVQQDIDNARLTGK